MTVTDPAPIVAEQPAVIDTMDRPLAVAVTVSGDQATVTFWREGYRELPEFRQHPEYRLLLTAAGCAALEQGLHDARLQLGGEA